MAKGKKTGGRQKGSRNAATIDARAMAQSMGISPIEILLKFAAGDWKGLGYESEVYHMETPTGETKLGYTITPNMRLTAAEKASKYLYPTLGSVEVSTAPEGINVNLRVYRSKDGS